MAVEIKGLGDDDLQRKIDEYVAKAVEKQDQSAFNLPSIADFFGIETDNPLLNYKGLFAKSEDPNVLDTNPEELERVQQSADFQRRMLGYMGSALPILGNIFGSQITKPVLRRQSGKAPIMEFEHVNRVPGLTDAIVNLHPESGFGKILAQRQQFVKTYGENPGMRGLAASYNTGDIGIGGAEYGTMNTLNKDPGGKSLFDRVFDLEIGRRGIQLIDPKNQPYAEATLPVSKFSGANMKVGEAYVDLDTSAGCIGTCTECYAAYGGATQGKKCFAHPVPLQLGGNFESNPKLIRRIGTKGDPNMNPNLWEQYSDQFKEMVTSGKMTVQQLDQFIDRTYDWSHTNEQIIKSGLDSPGHFKGKKFIPGGRDMTFQITKLQSLKNFDPTITKNLEVSIDPMMPTHFFKSLKNIEEINEKYPGMVNIMMRIRSVSTVSDEINVMQKIAVDFANRNDIPVMETRMRFKKADTTAMAQVQPEYYFQGGQYKHASYYPTHEAKLASQTIKEGDMGMRTFEIHSPEGPKDTNIWMQTALEEGKMPKMTHTGLQRKIWDVYSGGFPVGVNLSYETAMKLAKKTVSKTFKNVLPGKIKVQEYSIGESPLSQFGLKPKLHKQCNIFNMGEGACEECQGCKVWLNEEMLKAYGN